MKKSHSPSNQRSRSNVAAPFVAAVLAAASLASVGAAERNTQAPSKAAVNTKEVVLPVEGMSCVACVARVKKEISAMPGVGAVIVNLAERNARISFDPTRITPKELVAAIDKLGYKAGEPKDAPKQDSK